MRAVHEHLNPSERSKSYFRRLRTYQLLRCMMICEEMHTELRAENVQSILSLATDQAQRIAERDGRFGSFIDALECGIGTDDGDENIATHIIGEGKECLLHVPLYPLSPVDSKCRGHLFGEFEIVHNTSMEECTHRIPVE